MKNFRTSTLKSCSIVVHVFSIHGSTWPWTLWSLLCLPQMPIALNHKPFGQELEAQLADLEAAEEAVRGPNCLKTREALVEFTNGRSFSGRWTVCTTANPCPIPLVQEASHHTVLQGCCHPAAQHLEVSSSWAQAQFTDRELEQGHSRKSFRVHFWMTPWLYSTNYFIYQKLYYMFWHWTLKTTCPKWWQHPVGIPKNLIVPEEWEDQCGEPQDTVPATEEEVAASIHGTPGSKTSSEVPSAHVASAKASSPSSPVSSLPPSASQAGDDVPSQNYFSGSNGNDVQLSLMLEQPKFI